MKESEKYTYLAGTRDLRDGLPCTRINWERGVVEEPTCVKGYADDNPFHIGAEQWFMQNNRAEVTPIKEYPVYPVFMLYLYNEDCLERWKACGGRIIPNKNMPDLLQDLYADEEA